MTAESLKNPSRVRELRRALSARKLQVEIARCEAVLTAAAYSRFERVERSNRQVLESYYDPTNFVDLRDYLPLRSLGSSAPTQIEDRRGGQNAPFFRTEMELAEIRGMARVLHQASGRVAGLFKTLVSYVVGTGFTYKCVARSKSDTDLARQTQTVIDRWLKSSRWVNGKDRERLTRLHRDGDVFLGLWHEGNGRIATRFIEPDQVTEPSAAREIEEWLGCDEPSSWSFGIHTDDDDVETIHGYYVQWSNNAADWDYLPGGEAPYRPAASANTWCEHLTANVDSNVKRGISDLFAVQDELEEGRKLLRNLGRGASLQSAIAWIEEYSDGVTGAQVDEANLLSAVSSYQQRTQGGGQRTISQKRFGPGSIPQLGGGVKYVAPPMAGDGAVNFSQVLHEVLRAVAVRWQMPEHMLTGSAENNNYASSLVAESPFVKECQHEQRVLAAFDERVLWKVLEFSVASGEFGAVSLSNLRAAVEIQIVTPDVTTRDRDKETTRRMRLLDAGVMSPGTAAAEEGLDYEKEVQQGARRRETMPVAGPNSQSQSVMESLDEADAAARQKVRELWAGYGGGECC